MRSVKFTAKKAALPAWILSMTAVVLFFGVSASAQTDAAPPPLRVFSKDERARLDARKDLKERTKLAVELMNTRLLAAERRRETEDFLGVFQELGAFHGLMEDALVHLNARDTGSNRMLDNFKRIEIALRGFAPRLEAIRREIPIEYDDYIRLLLKQLREARTRATEPMFTNFGSPE